MKYETALARLRIMKQSYRCRNFLNDFASLEPRMYPDEVKAVVKRHWRAYVDLINSPLWKALS